MNPEKQKPEALNLKHLEYKLRNYLLAVGIDIKESDNVYDKLRQLQHDDINKFEKMLSSEVFWSASDAERNHIRQELS